MRKDWWSYWSWRIYLLIIAALLIAIALIYPPSSFAGSVTLAWDANAEDDLAGYKIYYGLKSRYDPSLDPAKLLQDVMDKWCGTGTSETVVSCRESWIAYCSEPDLLCDLDFFEYDETVDVKNVTEYTLVLPDGEYFLSAAAYNDKYNPERPNPNTGQESKFSEELFHTIDLDTPHKVLKFRKMKPPQEKGNVP